MSFKEKLQALFSANAEVFKKHNIKLAEDTPAEPLKMSAETELADGSKLYTDADSFAVGVAVYTMDEAGNPVPAAAGEYTIADGSVMMIDDSGMVAELSSPTEDMTPEEMMAQIEQMAQVNADLDTKLSAETEAKTKAVNEKSELQTKFNDVKSKLAILEKKPAPTTAEPTTSNFKKDDKPQGESTKEMLERLKQKQSAN